MRATWLESHDEFEGVGAHELNDRYDHVDDSDGEYDDPDDVSVSPVDTPALARAEGPTATPSAYSVPGRLDGADTSHYQVDVAPMDLNAAKSAGLFWWAHKVSQSVSFIDPTWHGVALQMQKTKFRNMLGYHWLSSTTDPVRQAAWVLRCMGDHARTFGVMGDCEEGGLDVDRCLAFYEAVERVTKRPCAHYTGAFVSGGTLFADWRIRESFYGMRPVILAAYCSRERMEKLPNVTKCGHQAWQYSSNGPVPGVSGRCDMDEVSDPLAFDRACNLSTAHIDVPPPSHIEDVTPIQPPPPAHQEHGTMQCVFESQTTPREFNAMFFGTADSLGRTIELQWSGPGDDPAVRTRIETMLANFGPARPLELGGVRNNRLHPKHRPSDIVDSLHLWTDDDFAP